MVDETPVLVDHSSEEFPAEFRSAEMRLLAGELVERYKWAKEHGVTFGGLRDMNEVLGYAEKVTPKMLIGRYERGGIAGRIVDAYPKATWRGGAQVIEDPDKLDPEKFTTFEKAFLDVAKRLRLWARCLAADILAGQGHYSVLLIGAPGRLSEELPKGRPDQLLYLQPFSQQDAAIVEWDTKTSSARFGYPISYKLSRTGDTKASSTDLSTTTVHWTRILHIAEGALDNDIYGLPRLLRVWNLLDDLDKVTGGGAEAFWNRANRGIQFDIDKKTVGLTDAEKEAFRVQIEEYKHSLTRILRTRGVNVNELGSDVADFANSADAILTQIAGSIEIPKRILTGSELGELASTQDRNNWDVRVQDRRVNWAQPMVVEPLVDRLIEFGYLPKPVQYETSWPIVEALSESDKAKGAESWARANQAHAAATGKTIFSEDEIRDKWHGMPPAEHNEIEEDEDTEDEEEQNAQLLAAALREGRNVNLRVVK